jgi:hypothetical protein
MRVWRRHHESADNDPGWSSALSVPAVQRSSATRKTRLGARRLPRCSMITSWKVPPSKQRWSLLAHGVTLPNPSATIATDPFQSFAPSIKWKAEQLLERRDAV